MSISATVFLDKASRFSIHKAERSEHSPTTMFCPVWIYPDDAGGGHLQIIIEDARAAIQLMMAARDAAIWLMILETDPLTTEAIGLEQQEIHGGDGIGNEIETLLRTAGTRGVR